MGAGVAGGALALALADQGKKIVLLEKCLEEQVIAQATQML